MSHSATDGPFEAGDVVIVNLDPTVGSEKNKTRACLVIEGMASRIGLCIVVPITDADGNRKSKIFVPVIDQKQAGLQKPSVVDTYQIRAVDKSRIKRKLGQVDDVTLANVRRNLAMIIGIDKSLAIG